MTVLWMTTKGYTSMGLHVSPVDHVLIAFRGLVGRADTVVTVQ